LSNRFEQVDEVVEDAITIVLAQRPDGQWAKVHCPRAAHPSFAVDRVSEPVPPKDGLSGGRQARQPVEACDRRRRSRRRLEAGMG
jgi:hypothetical protein